MISNAFWEMNASDLKITRSDDSSHTSLLQTNSNCLQGKCAGDVQYKIHGTKLDIVICLTCIDKIRKIGKVMPVEKA